MADVGDSGDGCDDNTRLLWSELPEYNDLSSWDEAGTGGIIDGALMTVFGLLTLRLMIRKR